MESNSDGIGWGLATGLSLGIKIDIVLGDFDREHHPEEFLAHQFPVEIIHTPDQDKTDLEKGIDLLLSRNHRAINIVWATGLRADHTINNISNLAKYKNKGTLVIYDDHSKIYCLPNHFDKWYPKGANISLIPLGLVTGVITVGLKYNLNGESLQTGVNSSSSNEAIDEGTVKIFHSEGNLLMMECKD